MSKYESTSYLYTLFDIQCCQSVIRKLVYGFMCRLDSSVNCIMKGILASYRLTARLLDSPLRLTTKGVTMHRCIDASRY